MISLSRLTGLVCLLGACVGQLSADTVLVTIENTGPSGGTYITPVFAGFHDGTFDLFDTGAAASTELERLAEDGNTGPLTTAFAGVSETIGGATAPGGSATSGPLDVDLSGLNRYLTLGTMVVPSNDFFLGNSDPLAFDLSSLAGAAFGTSLTFDLTRVYDAGTEVNDFNTSAANGLLSGLPPGQGGPNQGADENGLITLVDGADPFAGFANRPTGFNPGLASLRVTITAVPEPSSAMAIAAMGIGMVTVRRRRRR